MDRLEVITSVERRRRWSASEKERWVEALREPGANVSAIARRAGISASYLYRWRRELEGDLHSVVVAHSGLIKPQEFKACDGEFRLN